MNKKILGLDLGIASVGWGLIEGESKILKLGVNAFTQVVDAKTKIPKNQKRREARSARKLIRGRRQRKNKLKPILASYGATPITANPYEIRTRGVDNALTKEELATALLHLCARRGFKSNRKTDGP